MVIQLSLSLSLSLSRFPRAQRGFTLVELSIVLVVIGLLIGGILVGQSLISSARLTSQIRQLQQYDVATQAFVMTFGTYPGDAPLPTTSNGCCNPATGDGDRIISTQWAGDRCAHGGWTQYSYECGYFFEHLSKYGGLTEQYSANQYSYGADTSGTAVTPCGIGKPFPASILYTQKNTDCVFLSQNAALELFWLIAPEPFNNNAPYGPGALTGGQALALDTKLDDGFALTGDIAITDVSPGNSVPGCSYGPGSCTGDARYPYAFWGGTSGPAFAAASCITDTAIGKYNPASTSGVCNLQIKAHVTGP